MDRHLQSIALRPASVIQSEVVLPYELKLMIFKNCDLHSIRSLRLVSKSWAEVGLDILLLPNFTIWPQKSKTIKSLEFISNDWDFQYFREIFSNRVETPATVLPNSFVPTEDERKALDELDTYEAHIPTAEADCSADRLVLAFRVVPNCDTIKITSRCVFQHQLLKRPWAEFIPGPHINYRHFPQVSHVLHSAALASRHPKRLVVEELSSYFVGSLISNIRRELDFPNPIRPTLKDIEVLHLGIEDVAGLRNGFSPGELDRMIRLFLESTRKLKSLWLAIEYIESWSPSILLGPETWPQLESLHLSNIRIEGKEFLDYLGSFKPTLKRLQLCGVRILGEMRCEEFLTKLRDVLDLERFQICGSIWHEGHGGGDERQNAWYLRPHCDKDWKACPKGEGNKSCLLEKFVLEDGPWPMTAEDNDFLLDL